MEVSSPPSRKRGRPPKPKTNDQTHPPLKVSKTDESTKTEHDEEDDTGREVFRKICVYPEVLLNPHFTGIVALKDYLEVDADEICAQAESKRCQVQQGLRHFGKSVVIPSFRPCYPNAVIPMTSDALILMHALCSSHLCTTRHGKVSVFPVTVFTSEEQKQTNRGGFPVLALHCAHLKTQMWRMYSATRTFIRNNFIAKNLSAALCPYDWQEDTPLVALSGFDNYTTARNRAGGTFVLLSAEWFDCMKHIFLDEEFRLKDIGDIFRAAYCHHPTGFFTHRFQEEHRAIWIGEERETSVCNTIKGGYQKSNLSMASCRSLSGLVRKGTQGLHWKTREPNTDCQITYDQDAFAYGVICWDAQLRMLNDCYTYFTGKECLSPTHMCGFFSLDTVTRVTTRAQSIRCGIYDDWKVNRPSTSIRNSRYALSAEFREQYWGELGDVRTFHCRSEDEKKRLQDARDAQLEPIINEEEIEQDLSLLNDFNEHEIL